MNAIKMLHSAFNLQNWQEIDELRELWKFVANNNLLKLKKLEDPVLSRWWLVGACACSFKESFEAWEIYLRQYEKHTTQPHHAIRLYPVHLT